MAVSISIYFAARHLDWNLSSFPDGRWSLNPFCWQLLFVFGTWLAAIGARQKQALSALQDFGILRVAAWLYLILALVVTTCRKIPANCRDRSGLPARWFSSQPEGEPRSLPGNSFSRVGISLYLYGAARLARIPMASLAAGHQVRRGMATGLLRRRVSFVCRPSCPDHRTEPACDARSGQRRRDFDHDGRRLLRILV